MTVDHAALRAWQRVRRYAVPRSMIEECTRLRLAGDWRGACAAADIDVDIPPDRLDRLGRPDAERIAADLALLAPDLLRWNLPRALGGRSTLATGLTLVLSTHPGPVIPQETPLLTVDLPGQVEGAQRFRLAVGTVWSHAFSTYDLPPYLWSTAHVRELRAAYGASAYRLPGCAPDGAPATTPPGANEPDDPTSRAATILRLRDEGRIAEAWRAAGIELDPELPGRFRRTILDATAEELPHLPGLAAEAVRLATRYQAPTVSLKLRNSYADTLIDVSDPHAPRARIEDWDRGLDQLDATPQVHQPPPDLELLRHGLIGPDDLHPLVRDALFGRRTGVSTAGLLPAPETIFAPVRVRCGGEWHTVTVHDGTLDTPAHSAEDVRRERTLAGLGGPVSECVRVRQVWQDGVAGRLPRALAAQRRDVLQRVLHGGAPMLTRLLDAGLDPLMRDGRGQTFLHHLRAMDHTVLLPRLLAAGIAVDARDRWWRTPLFSVVAGCQKPDLVLALLRAGADPHAQDLNLIPVLDIKALKKAARIRRYYLDDDDDEVDPVQRHLNDWAAHRRPEPLHGPSR